MNGINKVITTCILCLVLCVFSLNVIASNFPTATAPIGSINTSAQEVWGTVIIIIQMLAFGAIIFAGVRYMFASADQKADIKKGLGMLTIGAVLVFAASTVVQFVISVADEVI